jgi:hypothetical protein
LVLVQIDPIVAIVGIVVLAGWRAKDVVKLVRALFRVS